MSDLERGAGAPGATPETDPDGAANGDGAGRWIDPSNWAGLVPGGLGSTKPHHFLEMARVAWQNRDELPYAWRILRDGCCDGCSLGTTGMRDWTMDDVHLCMVRLEMLRMNTMPAMDETLLEDPLALRERSSKELRELGRLPYPMVWHRGESGYRRIPWDEALDLAADRIRPITKNDPDRLSFYLTSRGIGNEIYYAFQKTARFLGTNNVDNSARICHAPSTSGLKETIGYGATTNRYEDWIGTDVLLLVGTNLANNQPVATKYIHKAKKAGTRVVVVNPYLEEGLENYWVPSTVESALFGTRIMDDFFQVSTGGDAAFFNGALKHMIETDQVDHDFIEDHTNGFDEVRDHVWSLTWGELEWASGVEEAEIRRFADLYAGADTSVTVWSMGITQHTFGQQNVFTLSNLAMAQGRIGRPKCGLNPIRGHSGVQGGAEMGCVPSTVGMGNPVSDPDVRERVGERWGFEIPDRPGLSATASLDAMARGEIDALWSTGGNFLETLPDPGYVRKALDRVPVKIFQDVVTNPMMLLEPADVNLVFPAATRYETPGGITETNTERRVIFSPEIPGRRIGEARPEWEPPVEVARRVDPLREHLLPWSGTADIREDIAGTIEAYGPIAGLSEKGDHFQWGGPYLCAGYRFNTPDGKANFRVGRIPDLEVPEDRFIVSTRRGKQFNSMVWHDEDPLTGAGRDAVFVSRKDADRLGLEEDDPVLLRSETGQLEGRVRISRIRRGNLQVHWPEGNVLIATGRVDPSCGEPDFNAVCELVPL